MADEKEVEYVAVEEEEKSQEPVLTETDDDEDDDTLVTTEEEDDAGTDAEREKIRERRRQEKKERKERRTVAINRDRIELDFLRKRNDELEKRLTGVEVRNVANDVSLYQQQLQEAIKDVNMAEQVIAKAVEAGNGEDVTKALRYRDEAMRKAQQLDMTIKQRQAHQAQISQPKDSGIDPVVMEYAKDFLKEHSWYDTSGKDEDSAIVLAIDNALTREGYNAQTEEYWNELRKRVKRRLPEKFVEKEQQPERKTKGGPNIGSGREHAPVSTRKEVYISPERKAALIEAGVWDDPVLRQRYIKKYMEYDRAQQAGR